MTEEIIIAGFGGQGVLSMGQVLCYSGVMQGKEVSWMPSYGPEMRGGTANCIAILSDEPVCSPVVARFDTAIVLNQPSMDKFESGVKPGGVLIYDKNSIINCSKRTDINIYEIDASNEAVKMKNSKIMNMIVLGGMLKIRPILEFDNVKKGLAKVLPERYHNLLPLNFDAIHHGMEIIKLIHKAN